MGSERDHGAAGVVVAFALGALAGAVVALLFAPAKGGDTRGYLSDRAREGREKVKDAAGKTREYLNKQKETLASAIDRGREAYQAAREKEQA
ncbi:MAG: YtxH domain-containing protein [Acidobacteriota bacterium]